jgi:hypothetical protein
LLLNHASGIGRQDVSEGTLIVDELVSADLSERSSPSELTERLETREQGSSVERLEQRERVEQSAARRQQERRRQECPRRSPGRRCQ